MLLSIRPKVGYPVYNYLTLSIVYCIKLNRLSCLMDKAWMSFCNFANILKLWMKFVLFDSVSVWLVVKSEPQYVHCSPI